MRDFIKIFLIKKEKRTIEIKDIEMALQLRALAALEEDLAQVLPSMGWLIVVCKVPGHTYTQARHSYTLKKKKKEHYSRLPPPPSQREKKNFIAIM